MTGIVIDSFGKDIFVFADGRLTSGDEIFTETYSKVVKLANGEVLVFCGDVPVFDIMINHITNGTDTHENLSQIKQDSTVVWVSDGKIVEYDFDSHDNNGVVTWNYNTTTFTPEVFPLFFGSGTRGLTAAYYALNPKSTNSKAIYLDEMRKVFDAASKRLTSMGPLYMYETVKLRRRR